MPKTTSKPKKSNSTKRLTTKRPVKATTKKASRKGVTHHAKHLYHITPKFVHGMVVGAVIGIMALVPIASSRGADALTISSGKDCDAWSIINCGVQSTSALQKAYQNSGYVSDVFKYFTISSTDIANVGKTAVKGTVYNNGKVTVDGKVVATDAKTAARQRVTSQDKKITYSGSVFYTRPLELSWSHKSAPAYVVMKSGVFDYAVLAPCGNPIVATPKKPTKPTPKPDKPTPTPPETTTPTPPVDTNVTPPAETPVHTTTVTSLPKTGISSAIFIFVMAVIGGYVFHMTHHHVKRRRHHVRHHTHHNA